MLNFMPIVYIDSRTSETILYKDNIEVLSYITFSDFSIYLLAYMYKRNMKSMHFLTNKLNECLYCNLSSTRETPKQ